jgi:hypothetical protein
VPREYMVIQYNFRPQHIDYSCDAELEVTVWARFVALVCSARVKGPFFVLSR